MITETIWKTKKICAGFGQAEGQIENVNLEIQRGDRIAFLGGDRSGANLLLRVLCGLRIHKKGSLELFGGVVSPLNFYDDWDHILSRPMRRRLGVSLEKEGLLANVSVAEGFETVMRFGAGADFKYEGEFKQTVLNVLKLFKISHCETQRPHLLSVSEKRFASLARAFLLNPEVFIFESPTKGLEESDRGLLVQALDSVFVADPNKTLVMATEDWPLAVRYCTRVVVLKQGKVDYDGSWDGMRSGCPDYWLKISDQMKSRWNFDEPLRKIL